MSLQFICSCLGLGECRKLIGNIIEFFYVFKENPQGFSKVRKNLDEIYITYIFNSKVFMKMDLQLKMQLTEYFKRSRHFSHYGYRNASVVYI